MNISVADIIRTKTKRHVPNFVIRWLEKLIHQDEMNAFLAQYGHLQGFDFLDAFLSKCLQCTYTVHQQETLCLVPPTEKKYVFVSNHPLGGLDGIILLKVLHDAGLCPQAIVNDMLLHLAPLKSLFVPVNKVGTQAREYVALQQQLWQSDHTILSFPAGACSRLQHGKIQDLEWRNTFLRNAVRYRRDIVPVYFEGTNSRRFYRVAQWRKWLHIPVNLEMMLLPDEMFRARGSHYQVYFGQPIPWQSLSSLSVNDIRHRTYTLNS